MVHKHWGQGKEQRRDRKTQKTTQGTKLWNKQQINWKGEQEQSHTDTNETKTDGIQKRGKKTFRNTKFKTKDRSLQRHYESMNNFLQIKFNSGSLFHT